MYLHACMHTCSLTLKETCASKKMDRVPAPIEREVAEEKENEQQPIKSAIVLTERADVHLHDEKIKPVADQTKQAPASKVHFVLPVTKDPSFF